jgi:hypothetical protein
MDRAQFDQIATFFAETSSRRRTLRLLSAAALGAGGLSLVGSQATEAKRRRKKKKKKQDEEPQEQFPDIAITAINVSPTSEANHDNVVIVYSNIGTLPASGFRIGMVAKRSDGTLRNEVFSLPLTLAPGATATETFRLGCSWLNNGTITARTDPSPIPGEPAANIANNTLSVTFGAAVCS